MANIMEFLGLKFFVLYFLIVSCTSKKTTYYSFVGKSSKSEAILDTLFIIKQNDKYTIKKGIFADITYSIDDKGEVIYFNSETCRKATEIILENKSKAVNNYDPVYPFFGEEIIVLDSKVININSTDYFVYKIFNENGKSYTKSSIIFWLKGFGILMIKLSGGKYYELCDMNNSHSPWKSILKEIKADVNFSELWEIPPVPQPPPAND
jgi:hypothetical protein